MLGLKKSNCIAWTEIPEHEYRDQVIEANICLDSLGGYSSAGIMFRIMDESSYYIALISSKGYFRIDAVKNSSPRPLIAWTEVPDFDEANINFKIITYGTYLIFIINGKWVGEASDDSISSGRLGFAIANYETASADEYTCKATLKYFSVNSGVKNIEENYKTWSDDSKINAEYRLRLAETFAVMGKASASLEQINRAWKRRDEAIRGIAHNYTEVRTKKELLLAARMSFLSGQLKEANDFLNTILEQWTNSDEGREALGEKIIVLNEMRNFTELKTFILKNYDILNKDIGFYTMLARCYWELKEYENSAAAWEKAFEIDSKNGVFAANAANALEQAGNMEKALVRFLEAGKIFLNQDNMGELAVMMPKLDIIGQNSWEARVFIGKWSFSIEDYDRCIKEFTAANKLRCSVKPRPKADPAHYYLWGLVLNIKGKNSAALRLLERAVKLAPDYGLFRFKLAEIKLITGVKNPKLSNELKQALKDMGDDSNGEMAVHAGNLLKKAGYAKRAKYFFDLAGKNDN